MKTETMIKKLKEYEQEYNALNKKDYKILEVFISYFINRLEYEYEENGLKIINDLGDILDIVDEIIDEMIPIYYKDIKNELTYIINNVDVIDMNDIMKNISDEYGVVPSCELIIYYYYKEIIMNFLNIFNL